MFSTAFLDLPPLDTAGGCVHLPGSKSISNRVLLLAALSRGTTTVHDLLASDDTRVMLDALRHIGCTVEEHMVPEFRFYELVLDRLLFRDIDYREDHAGGPGHGCGQERPDRSPILFPELHLNGREIFHR